MIQVFLISLWQIMLDLSPALLFGLFVAGLLHVFVPRELVRSCLSSGDGRSVLLSVLVGIPLPLCSCGVVPAALTLRKQGASKGASTGFLISTPQTGVDSFFVTSAFFGWPFALFKVGVALLSGVVGGMLVNILDREDPSEEEFTEVESSREDRPSLIDVVRFPIFGLLATIDLYLLIGVLGAAVLGVLIPEGYFAGASWAHGLSGMILALAFSLPLYICTTSSVPIAASLIAAGMPAGTALVFLMAGPATNVATMSMVYKGLGGRVLAIYVATVSALSVVLGLVFDWIIPSSSAAVRMHEHEVGVLSVICAVILTLLMLYLLCRRVFRSGSTGCFK